MFKSLRWRLQVWHAIVLLTVLSSFGGIVYGLHWQTRLQQVDAELHRTVNLVMSQFRRLLPRPARRARRIDTIAPESAPTSHPDQSVATRADFPANETAADKSQTPVTRDVGKSQAPSMIDADKSPVASSHNAGRLPAPATQTPPRERPYRDPGPLPPEFEQLFHGEEDSRLYFVIWGKDGELLQKSASAPAIDYPNFHVGIDGLPIRKVRERRTDHIYREVITSIATPRPPLDGSERNPVRRPDMNVLVGRSLEKDLAAQHQSGLRLATIGLVIFAAGVLGGGWLSARAIRPITDMTAAAEAISAQNLSERIAVKDADNELGKLANVLNGTFDRLQAAIERQRQFTADASHELRTPLSVIAAHTELALSRPRSNEDYRATIDTCQRASRRMKSLIDALLLLARIDSGAPSLKRERLDLAPLVCDCVDLVGQLATERGIPIECQTQPCYVSGDWDRLSQVVLNLLSNAIRYNVDGGRVRAGTRMEDGMAVFSVVDTGVGVAEDQLPLIFNRFYRVDKARSRAEGSCGLGLSICKTIVEAHGGTITAQSQLNIGTTMEVRLPLAEESTTSKGRESHEAHQESALAES